MCVCVCVFTRMLTIGSCEINGHSEVNLGPWEKKAETWFIKQQSSAPSLSLSLLRALTHSHTHPHLWCNKKQSEETKRTHDQVKVITIWGCKWSSSCPLAVTVMRRQRVTRLSHQTHKHGIAQGKVVAVFHGEHSYRLLNNPTRESSMCHPHFAPHVQLQYI